jgi:hypothetical protein
MGGYSRVLPTSTPGAAVQRICGTGPTSASPGALVGTPWVLHGYSMYSRGVLLGYSMGTPRVLGVHMRTQCSAGRAHQLARAGLVVASVGIEPGRSHPRLHRDWGSPLPHLHRDWGSPLPASAPGLGSPLPTSAPRLKGLTDEYPRSTPGILDGYSTGTHVGGTNLAQAVVAALLHEWGEPGFDAHVRSVQRFYYERCPPARAHTNTHARTHTHTHRHTRTHTHTHTHRHRHARTHTHTRRCV